RRGRGVHRRRVPPERGRGGRAAGGAGGGRAGSAVGRLSGAEAPLVSCSQCGNFRRRKGRRRAPVPWVRARRCIMTLESIRRAGRCGKIRIWAGLSTALALVWTACTAPDDGERADAPGRPAGGAPAAPVTVRQE